jgi:hypothetical protein
MTADLVQQGATARPSPRWSLLVAESVTGRVVGRLPLHSQTWHIPLGFGGGRFEPEVPLDGPPRDDPTSVTRRVRDIVVPGLRHMIVAVYGRRPVAYGYVTAPAPAPGSVRIGTIDLAGLLARRRVVTPGLWPTPSAAAADTTLGPTSKPNLARLLLLQSIAEIGTELPLDITAVSTSGTEERVYPGYQLASYTEHLQDLGDDDDGPDIRVTPILSADQKWVRLQVAIGQPFVGRFGDLAFNYPGNALDVMPDYDYGEMAARHYVPGDGTDQDKPIGVAVRTNAIAVGVPVVDRVDTSRGRIGDLTQLNSFAAANAAQYEFGLESFTLTVSADGSPELGGYGPGDDVQIRTSGHWWLDNGVYRRRIVGIGGDHTDRVTITTAPVPEGV